MKVAVQVEFKADRKEPLGGLVRRVAAAFDTAGVQPKILATFSDSPGGIRTTSAVERALKKHPHLASFERADSPLQGIPSIRRLTNSDGARWFQMTDILALADGVPRSLPFHTVSVHFGHEDFGDVKEQPGGLAPPTGVAIADSWWVNGRNRALSAFYAVDADAQSKKLPDPPGNVGAVMAAFGKPKRSAQFVLPHIRGGWAARANAAGESTLPPDIAAVSAIVIKYRQGMSALIERINLPSLPQALQANRGASGPLKPTLVAAFQSRGFDCRGESGTFTLRRRTAANHVVDLELDVGTWSRSLTAMFHVHGPGFNATLMLPVSPQSRGQYPIGDTANWERIVANLGVVVDELSRTFVTEIEAAVGRAPDWFQPGR